MGNLSYSLLVFFNLLFFSCQSQEFSQLNLIKNEAARFLNDEGDLSDKSYKSYINTGKGISINGIHNNLNKENPSEGIYSISISNHSRIHFLLFSKKDIQILSLSDRTHLSNSIGKVIEYSREKKLCKEITQDYISRLVTVYYTINKNLKTRLDRNCEFKSVSNKSEFSFLDLNLTLAEYLVDVEQLTGVEHYIDNPDFLIMKELGYYYGMPDASTKLNTGVYSFANYENENPIPSFLLMSRGDYDIVNVSNETNLIEGIGKLLSYAEENTICFEEINSNIISFTNEYYSESCLDNFKQKLP